MGEQRNDPTITVDKKLFERVVEDSDFLDCLKACGVDNWEGYSLAVQMYNEQNKILDEDDDEEL